MMIKYWVLILLCAGLPAYGQDVLEAVKTGDLELVKIVVQAGGDINAKDNGGSTALHSAAQKGQLEVVKYLVEQGADINANDKYGRTALHYTAQKGQLEMVKYLVEQGADIHAKDSDGKTPLHNAATMGYVEEVKYLVAQGADIHAKDNYGNTALLNASGSRSWGVVGYLVYQGADVNAKDNGGSTALHYAAQSGNLEVVGYLVEQGADVNAKDNGGETALKMAKDRSDQEIVRFLYYKSQFYKDLIVWSLLLFIVNVFIFRGRLLGYAIAHNLGFVAKLLTLLGARLAEGPNAFVEALLSGKEILIDYYLTRGADINGLTQEGLSPLCAVLAQGNIKTVRYLLEKGANPYTPCADGQTALETALKAKPELQELLLKYSPPDAEGETWWHRAVRRKSMAMVDFLKGRLDINARDKQGRTPLHIAVELKLVEIGMAIIRAGGKP